MIEPAAGADRAMLACMCDAYDEEEVEGSERMVLRLHPRIAPVKVAVLPLVNRDGMPELAREIYEELRARMPAEYDAGGSIGKRYRRQDEIGTPWGVTVDGQTTGGPHGHAARPRLARAGPTVDGRGGRRTGRAARGALAPAQARRLSPSQPLAP